MLHSSVILFVIVFGSFVVYSTENDHWQKIGNTDIIVSSGRVRNEF